MRVHVVVIIGENGDPHEPDSRRIEAVMLDGAEAERHGQRIARNGHGESHEVVAVTVQDAPRVGGVSDEELVDAVLGPQNVEENTIREMARELRALRRILA